MTKFYQGKYKPKFPKKYNGDSSNIVYRSSWELQVFNYCDRNPDIVWWASEEMCITYISPIDGKRHRYFPDVIVKTKNGDIVMMEIKPFKQTQEPEKRKRVTKQYINEVRTYGINQAKWNAAERYCQAKGWKFQIVTEKELFKKQHK